VVQHPGAVVVLAVDERDRALVLHQYRHPVRRRMVELPAGLLDEPDEDPETAARRELREEALLEADHWEHLLTTFSSPGVTSERIEIFAATGLRAAADRGGFTPAHEEADMTSSWVPVGDLLDAFLARRITDGPTGHALMAWALRRST
jgi:ADP-ribose pyrophosphatase